jgi:dihydroorotate dehydrogenase
MIYPFLRKTLFALPPETAHHFGILGIKSLFHTPILSQIMTKKFQYENSMLPQNIMGLHFKNPVGLAAGFDKYCTFFNHFDSLGFGFGEIGTITPLPQDGNEKPRLFRDPKAKAILNRMGFNNGGMQKCIDRLQKVKSHPIPLCINIGKNKITPNENAKDDYLKLIKGLSDYASFFTVNISSPNTPGLRNLQAKADLLQLLEPIVELNQKLKNLPIALKIAPDMTEVEVDDIVAVVLKTGISSIITTNTTIDKSQINEKFKNEAGGVSGLPVRDKSDQVLKWVAQRTENKIPLIGVGGIFSAEDAYRKIKFGASLVEVYTGWIYQGPGLVKEINQGLVKLLKNDGFHHISEAIGKDIKK